VRKTRPARNPLEPISSMVSLLTALAVAFPLLSLLVHQQAWGNGPVCTSVSDDSIPTQAYRIAVSGLARGSQATIGNVIMCADQPSASLRLAGLLVSWPSSILFLGFLVQIRGLLKAAARPGGLYSPVTARRLRLLGWLLTSGALVAGIIESAARTAIFLGQIRYPGLNWFEPGQWQLSLGTLLLGLALITIARVTGVGATMREELDATI
jgi:hypothetical protein